MRLSGAEFWAMNSGVRRLFQKHLEFKTFKRFLDRHGIDLRGKTLLDLGCGSGYGSQLISEGLAPGRLVALDLMPEQIRRAEERRLPVEFRVGDAEAIDLPDGSIDAVFVFGVLHHVPRWRRALAEIARVVRPGGWILLEEPSRFWVDLFTLVGFRHPRESRFQWPEFETALRESGLRIVDKTQLLGKGFMSFLCVKA
jgi:ubiquinone/menaquinone biosynthesis C-methylase UbiE